MKEKRFLKIKIEIFNSILDPQNVGTYYFVLEKHHNLKFPLHVFTG